MPQQAAADPTLAAGELDKRVTLLRPVYNEPQDEITGYEPVATVWAAVEPAMGVEMDQAGRTVETVMVNMRIRYRRDIDTRWRIQDHEHVYEIKGVWDTTRRRVQLQLN